MPQAVEERFHAWKFKVALSLIADKAEGSLIADKAERIFKKNTRVAFPSSWKFLHLIGEQYYSKFQQVKRNSAFNNNK